ncbi:MAG: hypothetical protein JW973_07175 [Bacteroidales bacterium]|nr:hypothetical protein [Bacteroidales bacterium]
MKKLLFILFFGIPAITGLQAQLFVFSAETDLNGNGKAEKIKLEQNEYPNGFRLWIDDKETINRFNNGEPDGFMLVDIDTKDNYKEIVVHTPGPSDDDEYMVYWFDGEKISLIDFFPGWPVFNGNGIIYVDQWNGFWTSREKIVVDKINRVPHWIEQFAYYVGVKARVKKGFLIYKETDLINQVAILSDGSEIELLVCDKTNREYFDYRYLIKSAAGLIGWADFNHISENTDGLPLAD